MASESIFNLIDQHQRQPAKSYEELTTVATHAPATCVEQQAFRRAPSGAAPSRGPAAMPNMKAFELAQKHMNAEADAAGRAQKTRTKPSVPSVKKPELAGRCRR
jgi:hypothetical protein